MTDLEKALASKSRARKSDSDDIWVGFSSFGDDAKATLPIFQDLGVTNRVLHPWFSPTLVLLKKVCYSIYWVGINCTSQRG